MRNLKRKTLRNRVFLFVPSLFQRILAADNADEEKDDRDDQKDMDESSQSIAAQKTKKPKNYQNNCYCCKHNNYF